MCLQFALDDISIICRPESGMRSAHALAHASACQENGSVDTSVTKYCWPNLTKDHCASRTFLRPLTLRSLSPEQRAFQSNVRSGMSGNHRKPRDCVIVLVSRCVVEFQVPKGLKACPQRCIPAEPIACGCRCAMQKSWLEAWHIVHSRDQVR